LAQKVQNLAAEVILAAAILWHADLAMKTHRSKTLLTLAAVLFVSALAGCSSLSTRPAGFLANAEALQPDASCRGRRLLVDKSTVLDRAARLIIEPVELRLPAAELARLDTATQQHLRQKADACLRAAWAKRLALAADGESATLRLRTAITQLDRSNPTLNTATTLLLFIPLDVGGISVESELCDARSGRRMAAVIDTRRGSPVQLKASFSQTGQAQRLFECIAEEFAATVCTNGGQSMPF
jgi:hypothetical protein